MRRSDDSHAAEHLDNSQEADEPDSADLDADFAATPEEQAARVHEFQDLPHLALYQARADARARRHRPTSLGQARRGQVAEAASARLIGTGSGARDPLALGVAVRRLIQDRGWDHQFAVGKLIGDWPTVIGPELAQHCTPTTFVEGELTIQCASTTYATSLKLLLGTLQQRIDCEVGEGVVTSIRIEGPRPPRQVKGKYRIHGYRGPRDTYG
ncbi:DUF721 domain-containing protein [Micrococcales bacterium 31B]|nr:DUF721 domain-containing protein [Micrococcales bacterium 31B]